jgi:D-serine deaminase-like pyridoxal phosphate-dependent protein
MTEPLATPCLLIHRDIVRQNIQRLADYAAQHEIDLRPHTKTHKSQLLAAMQLKAGAVGLTVAKVGEAEVMARTGDDILVAYPTVDKPRTRRLARLAQHKTIRVAVDSTVAADALAGEARRVGTTVGILVDVDVGLHRTGVASSNLALALAQHVDRAAGLRLDGLFCYPGHVWDRPDGQAHALAQVAQTLAETLDLWWRHGLEAKIVSGGSTPTAYQSHLIRELSEIRPGTYVLNDMNTVRGGFCSLSDCAAQILSTVVSNAVPNQVVLDAGSKTLTSDLCRPAPDSGHGYIVEYPDARIPALTEEHAQVDISRCATKPQIGEQVTIIPNHICPCMNLQDSFWWQEGDATPEAVRIDARGMVS